MSYTISQIADFAHGRIVGTPQSVITRLSIDSRKPITSPETLFIAIRGERHDGHQYINDLIAQGITHFVVNNDFDTNEWAENICFIKVNNTLTALQNIAKAHRQQMPYPIMAITGSNGKTIVKEWIAQLIGDDMPISRSPRSFNSQVGVPLSLWLLENSSQLGIIEAGISFQNEMIRLQKMIQPGYGLITNIGQAHQENFQSIEEKLDEKLKLFVDCNTLFYCRDHAPIHQAIVNHFHDKKLISWGTASEAWLRIQSKKITPSGTEINIEIPEGQATLTIPYTDAASYENAMHAVTFVLHQGIDLQTLTKRVARLKPVAMRLEQIEGRNGCLLINDTYNSDFTSLEIALDFLNQQARQKEMPRTLILSDIRQSGLPQTELYKRVAEFVAKKGVTRFIGIGHELSACSHLFTGNTSFFHSTDDFLGSKLCEKINREVILIKGSREFTFERITEHLEQRLHQTVMEINLDALASNLNYYRSCLKPGTRTLAMVKAFSYGSGSYEIAGLLQHQKVDYLGVAFADEGIELRRAGITLPIIVMNPEKRSFPIMVQYDLEPEVYSFKLLSEFAQCIENEGIDEYPIHLKIDTGMYRLGFLPTEIPQLTEQLKHHPRLKIKTAFSHLVGSEAPEHDAFTQQQIERFEQATSLIEQAVGYHFWRHILNSSGIERFPQAQYDMVRLGIGLYGISAVNHRGMRNVATLKSYISQIKEVNSDETIGYGRRGKLPSKGTIAVVPIGYADGLDRRLSNGVGKMMINGQEAPIVGNVCMDICMLDITNIKAREGDEVIIFGDQNPLWEMSQAIGTIPYEVLTGISRRVPRVYFQE
ncbi:UDP-N-acetylmuramoyl-tripeptide--D-alanyl-D-alanine ligase [Breznakibacter xylanolyticus]|uniref:Alanine racemase n=1 Tax=Breznakibacter xylanolyticus TaxID=990 RepID=A0A2W7NRP2_9BACT|nr:bifunctional UDP-N-acetylmuramoyl-tripeptide:D-alanyl-D-alanine ligase/alanine racemase [Breznakibacter xylanolyticus]PZX20777.1 UDP-N-acetylmuramoyl-tripeptide--D-alanyl-D-alanine ligase [Breznakibacter xylanolyticus]